MLLQLGVRLIQESIELMVELPIPGPLLAPTSTAYNNAGKRS